MSFGRATAWGLQATMKGGETMDAFVVNYTTKSNRRKHLLVLADTLEHAKRLAENYLNGEKIRSITYVVPEKNSSV